LCDAVFSVQRDGKVENGGCEGNASELQQNQNRSMQRKTMMTRTNPVVKPMVELSGWTDRVLGRERVALHRGFPRHQLVE